MRVESLFACVLAFACLRCAATSSARWSPAPPTAEHRQSLVNGIKVEAGEFVEAYGVRLGMSVPEAEERLGSDWSCHRLGRRSLFFECSHVGDQAPASVLLKVKDERVVSISMHWPSGETLSSACAEYREALRELTAIFGQPTEQDARLCEQRRDEPAYVESCSKWILGSSAMDIGAKPLLENLSQVGLGLTIGPIGTSTCRTEEE